MRDDCHFLGKALDMIRFFFKERKWDEQREVAVFDASGFYLGIHKLLDAFPNPVSPWPNDHASPDTRFLGQIGLRNDFLIPARKVLRARDG